MVTQQEDSEKEGGYCPCLLIFNLLHLLQTSEKYSMQMSRVKSKYYRSPRAWNVRRTSLPCPGRSRATDADQRELRARLRPEAISESRGGGRGLAAVQILFKGAFRHCMRQSPLDLLNFCHFLSDVFPGL